MMQTQTQVPPALQVLMSMGAQPTAPGPMGQPIPSVAMQKAQEQSQGLPQMAMAAGQAAPSVMRNMEMQKFQQMLEQAMQARQQQQAPGIAGLPAQNMQFADGGVVGYNGEGPSFVTPQRRPDETFEEFRLRTIAEQESVQQRRKEAERAKAEQERMAEMARRGLAPRSPYIQEPSAPRAPIPEGSDRRLDIPAGGIVSPGMTQAPLPSPAARTAAPRSGAPARTAPTAEPVTGIATALPAVTTPEEAMASARAGLGIPGTADLRAANEAARLAREQMPATGQAGLAALQEQMAAVKRMEEERKRSMASDRVIAQMLGRASEGLGGGARADVRFMAGQRAAEDAFYERNVALAAKQDAINDANEARKVGNKEKYAEAMKNLSDAERAIAQAEATYAAAILTNAGTVRGQNVQIQEGVATRATQLQVARIQAAARENPGGKEALAVARVQQAINGSRMLQELAKAAAMGFPGAQEKYAAEEARLYQRLAPELFGGAGAEGAAPLAPPPAGAVRVKGGG